METLHTVANSVTGHHVFNQSREIVKPLSRFSKPSIVGGTLRCARPNKSVHSAGPNPTRKAVQNRENTVIIRKQIGEQQIEFWSRSMELLPSRWLLASCLLAVFLCRETSAQTATSGALTGVVTDVTGAVLPGADVGIRDHNKGTTQSTRTDRQGEYEFFFLSPSRYTLTVAHAAFRTESRDVNVLLGPPVSVNLVLEVANTSTSVTVTAEAPLLHAENGDVSATMNQKQISEVPNPGNDLTYIVQTAPGVVMNTDVQAGANFSILGMPGTSYRYTIDGLSDTDNTYNVQLAGSLFLLLGQNQIQEATVVSTGYAGQFGGAAGGNVNYVTKSGGNEFHGNAQYYWNGRVLNANEWFNKEAGNPRPFDIANQWAGSFGGPIKKDKLFFFFDSEGLRLLIPQNFFVTIPSSEFEAATISNIRARFGVNSASDAFYQKIFRVYNAAPGADSAMAGGFDTVGDPTGCTGFTGLGTDPITGMPIPCARHFFTTRGRASHDALTSGRLDWNISAKDRAFLRLRYEGGRSAISTDPISSAFDADGIVPWWQGQVSETHTFGSTGASQFLFAGSYVAPIYKFINPSKALSTFPTVLSFNVPGTFTNLGRGDFVNFHGSGAYETRYQFSEDLVKAWRNHKLGVGFSFERNYWTFLQYSANTSGTLTPLTLESFYQGGVDPESPDVDFTLLSQSFPASTSQRFTYNTLGLYAQDEWRARPNLSLTFALRAEHQSNPVCQNSCFARLAGPFAALSHDPNQPYNQAILANQRRALADLDGVLWSPRVSFAWQPLGISHSLVLRGGVGVFHDPVPGAFTIFFSSNPPLLNSFTISGDNLSPNETSSNLFTKAAASDAEFVDGFTSGKTLAQIQEDDPNFSPPAVSSFRGRTHSPQYQKWSLQLEKAFGTGTSVSVGYFGHHGIHELVQNPNANAFRFDSLPAGLCTSPPVPPCADPRFSGVTEYASAAVSNYHGVVASLQHRFSRWSQGLFQVNYTYGHALDEVSNGGLFPFNFGSSTSPQDPGNLRGSYGPAAYDVRHSFNANYVWEPPVKGILRGRGPDVLLKGWQVSGTVFARTGFPYTVFDLAKSFQLAQNNYFGLLYAVPVGPIGASPACGEGAAFPAAPHPCQPPQTLPDGLTPNRGARFVQATCETGFNSGNLPGAAGPCDGPVVTFSQGRNRFRGPGYFNTDLAITKNTRIPGWETAILGIGFQFFNLFNHPNFGFPDNFSSDFTFGQIFYLEQSPTGILGNGFGGNVAPRMIQLKAQIQF